MFKLFGPVLPYDMIRMARRSRYLVMRCFYIMILLAVLYIVYQSFAWTVSTMGSRMTAAELAQFGESFFGYFLLTQYIVILLITPAYVAGAIAEEKQRKTLEYMLATDLRNREIVLGKLVARLANLLLFLLAGLPVISFAQLFGGIPPMLLWCGVGATFVTLLSLTSVSILLSAYARRVRDALIYSYLAILGYFVFWGFLEMLRGFFKLDPPAPLLVQALMDQIIAGYKAGNPFVALYDLVVHVRQTGSLGNKPLWLLLYYSIFHGLVIIFCITLAIAQVRRVYMRQAFGPQTRVPPRRPRPKKLVGATPSPSAHTNGEKPARRRVRRHPPVSNEPMFWKEIHVERGLRIGVLGQSVLTMLSLVVLLPGLIMGGVAVLNMLEGKGGDAEGLMAGMNAYVRWVGVFVTAMLLVGIGIRAANSIGAERDKLTLDGLLSAPLTLANILFAKWLGSILGMRWIFALLGFIWLLGLVSRGIHPFALFFMIPCLLAYSAFAASLGLLFSVTSKTALRAAVGVVLLILLVGIGPWVAAGVLGEQSTQARANWIDATFRSMSPLFGIQYASFCSRDLLEMARPGQYYSNSVEDWLANPRSPSRYLCFEQAVTTTAALLLFALAALGMWHLAIDHFRKTCGRTIQRPQQPALPLPVEPSYTAAT
jgi:ABC-type transport system involved in multi-copper enzyme maturation permease subunit